MFLYNLYGLDQVGWSWEKQDYETLFTMIYTKERRILFMSWSGYFELKYSGEEPEKFRNLCKIIIPNSLQRFDFSTDDAGMTILKCTRNLSWYTANADMMKVMNYLGENDLIHMFISGEGITENVIIGKNEGEVYLENSNHESNRFELGLLGITHIFLEDLRRMPLEDMFPEDLNEPLLEDDNDICSIDGYLRMIANVNEDIGLINDFVNVVLNEVETIIVLKSENLRIKDLKNKFFDTNTSSKFLSKLRDDDCIYKTSVKQDINDLPQWLKDYPEQVIHDLGGAKMLKDLIEKKENAKEMITMLADAIFMESEDEENSEEEGRWN